jgi:hypothetical protein
MGISFGSATLSAPWVAGIARRSSAGKGSLEAAGEDGRACAAQTLLSISRTNRNNPRPSSYKLNIKVTSRESDDPKAALSGCSVLRLLSQSTLWSWSQHPLEDATPHSRPLGLWFGNLLDFRRGNVMAQNLAQAFFQYFIASVTDSSNCRPHFHIRYDSNPLGR